VKEYEQANNKGRHEEQERQWTFSRTYNKGFKSRRLTRAVPSWHAVPILSSSFQAIIAFRVPTTSRRSMINVWIFIPACGSRSIYPKGESRQLTIYPGPDTYGRGVRGKVSIYVVAGGFCGVV
jgi:hypothetical protein